MFDEKNSIFTRISLKRKIAYLQELQLQVLERADSATPCGKEIESHRPRHVRLYIV